MKVTGPTSGVPGGAPEPIQEANGPAKPAGATEEAAGTRSAEKVGGGQAAAASHPLTDDIAADLAAGKIGPKVALERVVARIVDQQLGAEAPPAAREKLRAILQDTLDGDPLLADYVAALSSAGRT
jgi:hypothetical protein